MYPNAKPYDILQVLNSKPSNPPRSPDWIDFSTLRTQDEFCLAKRIVDTDGECSAFSGTFRIYGEMEDGTYKTKYTR